MLVVDPKIVATKSNSNAPTNNQFIAPMITNISAIFFNISKFITLSIKLLFPKILFLYVISKKNKHII